MINSNFKQWLQAQRYERVWTYNPKPHIMWKTKIWEQGMYVYYGGLSNDWETVISNC